MFCINLLESEIKYWIALNFHGQIYFLCITQLTTKKIVMKKIFPELIVCSELNWHYKNFKSQKWMVDHENFIVLQLIHAVNAGLICI